MFFWGSVFVVLYGAGLLLRSTVPVLEPFADTAIFVALGSACLVNFSRNQTLHCGITGPLFLLGAVAAAFIENGSWQFDMATIWGVVLVGVVLALGLEWRTVSRQNDPTACRR
jgi:hypothetical protein